MVSAKKKIKQCLGAENMKESAEVKWIAICNFNQGLKTKRQSHLSKVLKEVRGKPSGIWRRRVPGRRSSQCKRLWGKRCLARSGLAGKWNQGCRTEWERESSSALKLDSKSMEHVATHRVWQSLWVLLWINGEALEALSGGVKWSDLTFKKVSLWLLCWEGTVAEQGERKDENFRSYFSTLGRKH